MTSDTPLNFWIYVVLIVAAQIPRDLKMEPFAIMWSSVITM